MMTYESSGDASAAPYLHVRDVRAPLASLRAVLDAAELRAGAEGAEP